MANDAFELQGGNGFEFIDDTSAHDNDGKGYSFLVVASDATGFTALTGPSGSITTGVDALTYNQGFGIGRVESLTLSAGAVFAYY